MKRRGFLGAVLGLAAGAVAAKLPAPYAREAMGMMARGGVRDWPDGVSGINIMSTFVNAMAHVLGCRYPVNAVALALAAQPGVYPALPYRSK